MDSFPKIKPRRGQWKNQKDNYLNRQSSFGSLVLRKHYKMRMSGQIIENMTGFFKVLKEWEEKDTDQTYLDLLV
jgi:hypothetical protein